MPKLFQNSNKVYSDFMVIDGKVWPSSFTAFNVEILDNLQQEVGDFRLDLWLDTSHLQLNYTVRVMA